MPYVPEAGDIVWIDSDPQASHEPAGHRPAVVPRRAVYNGRCGLSVCCPTTTRIKGYPFEVSLAGRLPSVALADQVKHFDWRARGAAKEGRVTPAELAEIRAKLRPLVG